MRNRIDMSKKQRRRRLFRESNGICHWCGILTYERMPGESDRLSPNHATLDHLRSKHDKNRLEPNTNSEVRYVLSCFRCNQIRGTLHQYSSKFNLIIDVTSQPARVFYTPSSS